jgi:hypothetical protein
MSIRLNLFLFFYINLWFLWEEPDNSEVDCEVNRTWTKTVSIKGIKLGFSQIIYLGGELINHLYLIF